MYHIPYTPQPTSPLPLAEVCYSCGHSICTTYCEGQLRRLGFTKNKQASRAPGPSQNQHRIVGPREAETLQRHQIPHVASETISGDGYTGARPGRTWIGANEDAGRGEVWRTPSKNPLMADHN